MDCVRKDLRRKAFVESMKPIVQALDILSRIRGDVTKVKGEKDQYGYMTIIDKYADLMEKKDEANEDIDDVQAMELFRPFCNQAFELIKKTDFYEMEKTEGFTLTMSNIKKYEEMSGGDHRKLVDMLWETMELILDATEGAMLRVAIISHIINVNYFFTHNKLSA